MTDDHNEHPDDGEGTPKSEGETKRRRADSEDGFRDDYKVLETPDPPAPEIPPVGPANDDDEEEPEDAYVGPRRFVGDPTAARPAVRLSDLPPEMQAYLPPDLLDDDSALEPKAAAAEPEPPAPPPKSVTPPSAAAAAAAASIRASGSSDDTDIIHDEIRADDASQGDARAERRKRRKDGVPSKGVLAISEESAGAGVIGLLGFFAVFFVALVFFVTENYFISMFLISIALLIYVAGSELSKLLISSITIFFSSRHLIRNATYLQDTLVELRKFLHMRKDESGWVKVGPIEPGAKAKLPDNPLVRDIQVCLKREKGREYAEYVAHEYYVDCREAYDHFHAHLEFVAGAMPLFGLIGTIIGLIGMFDSLGANVSVEVLSPQLALALKTTLYGAVFASIYTIIASRFDQRIKALEYDYEILVRALDVMVENKAVIEVQA